MEHPFILVIDATVVFTGIIGTGVTKKLIFSKSIKLCCPEVLFNEVWGHMREIKIFSGLSADELSSLLDRLNKTINPLPRSEYERFLEQANSLISDKDNTEYLALSLSMNKCPIWSNDTHFREQSLVKVFTTEELVKLLKSQNLF